MASVICGGCGKEILPAGIGKFAVEKGGQHVPCCSERCEEIVFKDAPVRSEVTEMIRKGVKLLEPSQQSFVF